MNYVSTRLQAVGGETDMWTFADLAARTDSNVTHFLTEHTKGIKMPATLER